MTRRLFKAGAWLALALAAACGPGPVQPPCSATSCTGSGDGGADAGPGADGGASDGGADAGSAPDSGAPVWLLPENGITAAQLGVLVNSQDPQSVALAAYYVSARGIPSANVVQLSFPVQAVMSAATFATAKTAVDSQLPGGVQALALTWTQPYRVDCMSATSAFALGFDAGAYCSTQGSPCSATRSVPTYDHDSHRPFDELGVRPAMMLAAAGIDAGVVLIERGLAADGKFPAGDGWLIRTTDTARSVRWPVFQSLVSQWSHDGGLSLTYVDNSSGAGSNTLSGKSGVLFYFTGLASVADIATNTYRPGAVADHLTSFGGTVPTSGQMSILRWLEAGATASYGTVVEPCNYTQKFPNTQVLLPHYFRGEPIIEAYWKSVATPGEGNFIGEPLASPWGKQETAWDPATQALTLTTTSMKPGLTYAIDSAPTATGPWTAVQTGLSTPKHQRVKLTVQPATAAYYRLVRR